MSQRLTPQQQREMAVRMGCEVQNLNDMVSGFLPQEDEPIYNSALVFPRMPTSHYYEPAPVTPADFLNREDKLRALVVEAAHYLRVNAPGRALDVLEEAMKL